MTTMMKRSVISKVNEICGEDAAFTQCLVEVLGYLQHQEEYPLKYVDVLIQKWQALDFDIYDAYSFLKVHAAINLGWLGIFQIPVESGPFSDKEGNALNNQILSKLPYPFSAEFDPDPKGQDGYVKWEKAINVWVDNGTNEYGKDVAMLAIAPSMDVPLEVGYQPAEKTFFQTHTTVFGWGLARWPYGSSKITVLIPSERLVFADDEDFWKLRIEIYNHSLALPDKKDFWR